MNEKDFIIVFLVSLWIITAAILFSTPKSKEPDVLIKTKSDQVIKLPAISPIFKHHTVYIGDEAFVISALKIKDSSGVVFSPINEQWKGEIMENSAIFEKSPREKVSQGSEPTFKATTDSGLSYAVSKDMLTINIPDDWEYKILDNNSVEFRRIKK